MHKSVEFPGTYTNCSFKTRIKNGTHDSLISENLLYPTYQDDAVMSYDIARRNSLIATRTDYNLATVVEGYKM